MKKAIVRRLSSGNLSPFFWLWAFTIMLTFLLPARCAGRTLPKIKPVGTCDDLKAAIEGAVTGDVIHPTADLPDCPLDINRSGVTITLAGEIDKDTDLPKTALKANIVVRSGTTLVLRNLSLQPANTGSPVIEVEAGATAKIFGCIFEGALAGTGVKVLGAATTEGCKFVRLREAVRLGVPGQGATGVCEVLWCCFDTCYAPVVVEDSEAVIQNNLFVATGSDFPKDVDSAALDINAGSKTVKMEHNTTFNPPVTGGSAVKVRGGNPGSISLFSNIFVSGKNYGLYAGPEAAAGAVSHGYNDVYGFMCGPYGTRFQPDPASISKWPRFQETSPTRPYSDEHFQLLSDSPCKGKGQNGTDMGRSGPMAPKIGEARVGDKSLDPREIIFFPNPTKQVPDGALTLSWDKPQDYAMGPYASDIEIKYSCCLDDQDYPLTTETNIVINTFPDGKPISDAPHVVAVRALRGDFMGQASYFVFGKFALAEPRPPITAEAVAPEPTETGKVIEIAWSGEGNPADTWYLCKCTKEGITAKDSGWIPDTIWRCDGVEVNRQYKFTVIAKNVMDVPSLEKPTEPDKLYTLANPPTNFRSPVEERTIDSIKVCWDANGNPPGTQYFCECLTCQRNSGWSSSLCWNHEWSSPPGTPLKPNTPHELRVKAKNGDDMETDLVPVPPLKVYTLAKPPAGVVASEITETSITITWSKNGNPDGTEYIVSVDGKDREPVTDLSLPCEPFDPNSLHTFTVRAKNEDGVETARVPDSPLVVYTHANPPKRLADEQPSVELLPDSKMRVCWDANGNPDSTTHYTVTVKKRVSEAEARVVYFSEDLVSVCWDDIDLFLWDHEYEIWIQAENEKGVLTEQVLVAKYGPLRVEMGVRRLTWSTMPVSGPGYKLKDFRFWLDFSHNIQPWVSESGYPKQVDGVFEYPVSPDTAEDRMGFFKVQPAPQLTP